MQNANSDTETDASYAYAWWPAGQFSRKKNKKKEASLSVQ